MNRRIAVVVGFILPPISAVAVFLYFRSSESPPLIADESEFIELTVPLPAGYPIVPQILNPDIIPTAPMQKDIPAFGRLKRTDSAPLMPGTLPAPPIEVKAAPARIGRVDYPKALRFAEPGIVSPDVLDPRAKAVSGIFAVAGTGDVYCRWTRTLDSAPKGETFVTRPGEVVVAQIALGNYSGLSSALEISATPVGSGKPACLVSGFQQIP